MDSTDTRSNCFPAWKLPLICCALYHLRRVKFRALSMLSGGGRISSRYPTFTRNIAARSDHCHISHTGQAWRLCNKQDISSPKSSQTLTQTRILPSITELYSCWNSFEGPLTEGFLTTSQNRTYHVVICSKKSRRQPFLNIVLRYSQSIRYVLLLR